MASLKSVTTNPGFKNQTDMSSWEKDKEKMQQSVSNGANNNNSSNTLNNTNTLPTALAPPPMYYYQPFRPPVNPMMAYPVGPTGYSGFIPPSLTGYIAQTGQGHAPANTQAYVPGYLPYMPMPMNTGYMQAPNNYNGPTQQMHLNPGQTLPQRHQKPQNQKPPAQQPVKKPSQPPAQIQKKSQNIPTPQISSAVANYNLDDPEELEKWKAERRKKFPGAAKKEVEKVEVAETVSVAKELSDVEEGALLEETPCEDEKSFTSQKRKRICKYFSRGKCNKADSCQFEHVAKSKKLRTENVSKDNSGSGRSTIFENLLKIEEKESMIKFYECIKLIVK